MCTGLWRIHPHTSLLKRHFFSMEAMYKSIRLRLRVGEAREVLFFNLTLNNNLIFLDENE